LSLSFSQLPPQVQLMPNTLADPPLTDSDPTINKYGEYIRFENRVNLDMTSRCTSSGGCDKSNFASFFVNLDGSRLGTYSIPAFTVTSRSVSRGSDCNDGDFYDSFWNRCDSYYMIASICVKIRQTLTGWTSDLSYGGAGCGISSWEPAAYNRLRVYTSRDLPTIISVPLAVRSVKDPRVAFFGVMGAGSSLNFGLTQGEKATIGTVLLVFGVLIILCLGGATCMLCHMNKTNRYEQVGETAVVVPVMAQQQVYVQPGQPVYQNVYQQPVYQQQPQYAPQGVYQQQPQYAPPYVPPPYGTQPQQQPGYVYK